LLGVSHPDELALKLSRRQIRDWQNYLIDYPPVNEGVPYQLALLQATLVAALSGEDKPMPDMADYMPGKRGNRPPPPAKTPTEKRAHHAAIMERLANS